MDENIKSYIQTNAFYGYKITIDFNIGSIKCPRIDDLQEKLFSYIYIINKYIDLYETYITKFYNSICLNEEYLLEFASLLYFFIDSKEEIRLLNNKFYLSDSNFVDENNIGIFMETLKVLHHMDKKDDNYKPANKIAIEMMERARKLKKELESKIKNKDGIGFLEISSTVSARHPSINPTNIGQLNYFQIIDQYKRLLKIDIYTPCLYGNATEEYIKKNNVTHYSEKIVND